MSYDDETPVEKARRQVGYTVTQLITNLAIEGFEATLYEDPIPGYKAITRTRLEPPLTGLQAALHVQNIAHRLLAEQAVKAREGGVSWDDIGRVLGIEGEEWADYSPGETAYRHIAWGEAIPDITPPWTRREGNAYWTCRACNQRVSDRGPWSGHPDDCEQGHTEDCSRHRVAVAAWEAERDAD